MQDFSKKYVCAENTYYDEYERFHCIDAWPTEDQEEGGRTVAVVNDSGGVWYCDPDARHCECVVNCVEELQQRLRKEAVKIKEPETIDVTLGLHYHPNAYEAKKKELMACGMSSQEAMRALGVPFELEVFYSPNNGLFAVESEALESAEIVDPYTGNVLIKEED